MTDCRVTPSFRASRSSDSTIHFGKSTLTLLVSWLGLSAATRSRSSRTSAPDSNASSNSCAFTYLYLRCAPSSHGDDPRAVFSVGDHSRPVLRLNPSNNEVTDLVTRPRRYLKHLRIIPESLGFNKGDPVFCLVAPTLLPVKLELHVYRNYTSFLKPSRCRWPILIAFRFFCLSLST